MQHRRDLWRVLRVGLLCALLSACATLETTPGPTRPARDAIHSFFIEGRLAVRHGEEHFSARIEWQHAPGADQIEIRGPLGQGIARLHAEDGLATLETADRKRFTADDLDALSAEVFGIALPVAGLRYWVLGRAADNGPRRSDPLGRLQQLVEQGWTLDYLAYEDDSATALPQRLLARRDDIEVRLVIDAWSIAP